jgi:hypothetical protein
MMFYAVLTTNIMFIIFIHEYPSRFKYFE